jgi:prophage regulatory protein
MDKHHKILRRRAVEELTGYKRSSIYRLMAEGQFPRPVRLGPRAVGWYAHEIENFLAGLPRTERRA